LALSFGAILSFTSAHLATGGEELFAGLTSFAAVAFVTAMVFWMKRSALGISKQLHGKVDNAAAIGNFAVAGVAFFSVAREGLETSLFLYADFKTVSQDTRPLAGLILGLASAFAIGYLIFKRSITLNLSKFFRITGIALIVVAAGVLVHGISEFQKRGNFPGASSFLWNFHQGDNFFITMTDGTIGLSGSMTYLQGAIYIIYLVSTLTWFLRVTPSPATTVTPEMPMTKQQVN
jgi:high-affinity iron transporter